MHGTGGEMAAKKKSQIGKNSNIRWRRNLEEHKATAEKSLEGQAEGALSKAGLGVRRLPENVWVGKVNLFDTHPPQQKMILAARSGELLLH